MTTRNPSLVWMALIAALIACSGGGTTPSGQEPTGGAGADHGDGGAGGASRGGNAGDSGGQGGANAGGRAPDEGGNAGATQNGGAGGDAGGANAGGGIAGGGGNAGSNDAGSNGGAGRGTNGTAGTAGTGGASGGAGMGGNGSVSASACGVANACVTAGTRDAYAQPFDACSPWNYPIGDSAQYAAITPEPTSPAWSQYGAWVKNWASFGSIEMMDNAVNLEGTAPAHQGTVSGSGQSFTLQIPNAIVIPPDVDGHVYIVRADRSISIETYHAQSGGGNITADWLVTGSVRDDGVFATTTTCQHRGTRAYGGSALAGLVRHGEFVKGIPHAIALKAPQQALNGTGVGWVWPASCMDTDNPHYGTQGNVFMGSLLAIPPNADLSFITEPRIRNLANALRDYGGYITDRGADEDPNGFPGDVSYLAEYNDQDAKDIVNQYEQLGKMTALLQVVTNNGPSNRGGGGKPRVCFAAALANP